MPRSLVAAAAASLVMALAAAPAAATPAWQAPEPTVTAGEIVPAGGGTAFGTYSRSWMDAAGTAYSLVRASAGVDAFRLGVRPLGGPFGALTSLPTGMAGGNTAPLLTTDQAGNALLWSFDSRRTALRPAGAGAAFGPAGAGNTGIAAARLLDSGPALAISDTGAQSRILFRPAGLGSDFDLANAIALPPADGDTQSTPVGVAYDPDGQAAAVYRSRPSGTLLQTSTTGTPPLFGTPVAIPTSAVRHVFAAGPSGHAIVAWGADVDANQHPHRIVAAVRAPGGAFGAPETVVQIGADEAIDNDWALAVTSSGHPVVAYTRYPQPGDTPGCRPPNAVVQVAVRDTDGWQTPADIAGGYSQLARLAVAGDRLGVSFVSQTDGDDGDRCTSSDNVSSLSVALGAGTAIAPPTTLAVAPAGQGVIADDLAVSSTGGALFVYREPAGAALVQRVRVFEDPATPPPGPGPDPTPTPTPNPPATGGGGGTTPSTPATPTSAPSADAPVPGLPAFPAPPTPPPAVTAPGGIVVDGPIRVDPTERIVLRGECFVESTPCRFIFVLGRPLGGNTARAAAARPRLQRLGRAQVTVPAGATRRVRLRLNPAGRKLMRQHRSVVVFVQTTVQAGDQRTTTRQRVRLRR